MGHQGGAQRQDEGEHRGSEAGHLASLACRAQPGAEGLPEPASLCPTLAWR